MNRPYREYSPEIGALTANSHHGQRHDRIHSPNERRQTFQTFTCRILLSLGGPCRRFRLYLAAVIDLFSRQVVGWSLQSLMQASLVKDALTMAWWRRKPPEGLIFHSDRSGQYCNAEFQGALKGWSMRSSMSRKGNCWDNAPTESFWGRLKVASVHGQKFATREQARHSVMDWMAFYNYQRLHSTLRYLSPMQYEQRWYEAQRKKAA